MAIETERDVIGTLATVRGFPDVILRVKHVHMDFEAWASAESDIRCCYSRPRAPATCICEVVSGTPPSTWEVCSPFGHYRVAAKDLCLEGEPRV